MSIPIARRYLSFLALFVLFAAIETLAANPSLAFSFQGFEKSHTFDSDVALYGDAEIGDSMVRITRPAIGSRGWAIYNKPLKFLGTKPGFSTRFSFSISPGTGEGLSLAFLMAASSAQLEPADGHRFRLSPSVFAVEFFTLAGLNSSDLAGNHIEIDLGGEMVTKSRILSSFLGGGEKRLYCWIDYDGESKRVHVRLSKSTAPRPSNALISYKTDMSSVLWREAMSVAISSSSGNSSRAIRVHSWSFALKHGPPYLLHSEPLDPRSTLVKPLEGPTVHQTTHYPLRMLMAVIFGAVCGALVAFLAMSLWTVVSAGSPVAPVECSDHSVEVGYEKIVVVGHKGEVGTAKIAT